MPLQAQRLSELDSPLLTDGDPGFVGINAKANPANLAQGWLSHGENIRIESGEARTRPGHLPLAFLEDVTGPFFGTIYGAGRFADPNGSEWVLVSHDAGITALKHGNAPRRISPVAITVPVTFTQAFDRVFVWRGTGQRPLVWDGDFTGSFEVVPRNAFASYLSQMPNTDHAAYIQNRIVCPYGDVNKDQVAISDVLDYTAWSEATNQARVAEGSSGSIVKLQPYQNSNLLVFKTDSVWVLSNFYGTLADNLRLENVTLSVGCAARDSVVAIGNDVFFLARDGVYTIRQALENRLEAAALPVSDAIEPWIRRIDWDRAHEVKAAFNDGRYYLHVPVDSEDRAVFVYSFELGAWESWDTLETGYRIDAFVSVRMGGSLALAAAFTDVAGERSNFALYAFADDGEDTYQLPGNPFVEQFLAPNVYAGFIT